VSSIAPGSIGILESVGAWQPIADARVCPFRSMKVWDASGHQDGPEALAFDSAEFAVPQLGFIVENLLIQNALLERLRDTDVEIRYDTKISAISRHGHRFDVDLDGGESRTPDLLIGADGARSFVRDCAGISARSWQHDQKAFVTVLETEKPHQHTAWQRFLDTGPIGMLPLSDGRISIVWSTTPDAAEGALAMSDSELSAKLTDVSGGVLGKLTPAGPRGAFPLVSRHAKDYVQDGLALVGDAAHSIHPLAGQGVNLGFADASGLAAVLGNALDDGENPGDLPVLRKYERARKGANRTMLHFMDLLNRLFSNDSRALSRLRGMGMFLFNKSGPIREHAVQTALGMR
jgi:2-octaprenylphenol hydroxylase